MDFAALAWLIPTLCVLGFVWNVVLGRYLPPLVAPVVTTGAAVGAFLLALGVLGQMLAHPEAVHRFSFDWIIVLGRTFHVGYVVDGLSTMMLVMVTFLSTLIQLYSVSYMRGDPRFRWFFAVMSLFTGAMLTLVLADSFLLLYIAWELVGLCSYLLIGFWWERRPAAEAAKKAFITTRVGDVGMFIGILILWFQTGTLLMQPIFDAAQAGRIDPALLATATILLFIGAMGKSGQFPLHVWLPDAMEGPTPVSALIHAATMVTAGVYLVARTYPLFTAAPPALTVVLVIGTITALMAATIALVQSDMKRIFAYSTISQLGYMMFALGAGAYTAGMFHLFTHAFFKALLFLGAGAVMHATETMDIFQMGGLWRRMRLTAVTLGIGALSLAGFPLTAGFFSKDEILVGVFAGGEHNPGLYAVWLIGLVTAFLTAFYVFRAIFLAFAGPPGPATLTAEAQIAGLVHEPVGAGAHGHAAAAAHDEHGGHATPHRWEDPLMSLVLAVLAVLAVFAGWPFVGSLFRELVHAPGAVHEELNVGLAALAAVVAILGIALAWMMYAARWINAADIAATFSGLYSLLVKKYYFDDLYQWIVNRIVLAVAALVAVFDRQVVNDSGVDGAGKITVLSGLGLRYHVTGKLYNYALIFLVGAALITLFSILLGQVS
jgi:NADH-quinone oxidoreductase subunit L